MDSAEGADRVELILALNRFSDKIDGLSKPVSTSNVTLTSGGGMLAGITLGIMLSVVIATIIVAVWVSSELSDLKDTDKNHDAYINAIYQAAPHLPKPEPKQ